MAHNVSDGRVSFFLGKSRDLIMTYCVKDVKGIGKEGYLYSAVLVSHADKALRHGLQVLPANYTMPAFPSQAFTRWRHP